MKKDIHPKYYKNAKVSCACGNTFETGSTIEHIKTELCFVCHPFYTGKQKLVDSARRVEKFEAKLGAKKDTVRGKRAKRAINDILERERLPIVAGGTGFYINALIHDLELPKVKPNRKLRNELENLSTDQLVHRLKALDPRRAEEIDTKNRRRLVRAIEVVVLTNSQVQPLEHDHSNDPYHSLRIGLKPSDEELKRRISAVVHERIKNGVVDEIRRTHRRGIGWDRIYDLGLEYKFIADHIKGTVNLEEMAELIRKEYWHYVKRQMTWFKRDNDIIWIDAPEKAFPLVEDFLGLEASPSPDRLEI